MHDHRNFSFKRLDVLEICRYKAVLGRKLFALHRAHVPHLILFDCIALSYKLG